MPKATASKVIPITKPAVSYVSVDPDTATRWLSGNKVNRSIRIAKVNQFSNDMTSGRWNLSNDAICFAPDGTLLNGQHRLHAVIKAGVTMVMLVIRNMPPESMTSMDIGTSRTAADALGFDGEQSRHLLAAAGRLGILYEDGRIYQSTKLQAVSPGEIRDFIGANPLIRHSVTTTHAVRSKIDVAPSVLVVAHWIIADRSGVSVADYFLTQLGSRTGEPEGSAVLALDSRLRQLRHKRSTYSQRAYLSLILKAWNHYARDNRIAALTISANGKIPAPAMWQR